MKVKSKPAIDVDRYFKLMRKCPPLPITSEAEHTASTDFLYALLDKGDSRTSEEDAYLLVLGDIIEDYEEKAYPMGEPTDRDMLEHLIEARETTQAAVAKGSGIAESTISAVLHGDRLLTRKQIGLLSKYFKIDPGVFAYST
jgi:HTH-type transcriptional regulator/antitoxin HigA